MSSIDRRDFLAQSTAATTTTALGAMAVWQQQAAAAPADKPAGPNDVIRVGVIGLRGRGKSHIHGFEDLPDAQVVALCDVDERVLGPRSEELDKKTGRQTRRYDDLRRMLDDKEIDAVSIATPNHWHSLAGIWAMQAGKDVYVEKPCSHNVFEGRQLVNAARKYNRMCQHGTQGRSCPAIAEGIQKLSEGVIGDVYMARALCFKWRDTIGHTPDAAVPPGVNYDLWLGPAPERPFSENRFHYNWHWHWDYGNGDIGNQGVHEMDMARWGLGVGLPRTVASAGGHFMFDDDQETPNTLVSTFKYPEQNKMLVFEVRHWMTNHEGFGSGPSNAVGVTFYGSEGYMQLRYFSYATFLGRDRQPGPTASGGRNEWATFIRGVRSRKREDLGVDIEDGHLSATLGHLANVSYRLNRTIEFDPETETCPGDEDANRLLTRDYRSPFVVPRVG
jgi:predicted dehydrogenase